jgi:hypothetical protein
MAVSPGRWGTWGRSLGQLLAAAAATGLLQAPCRPRLLSLLQPACVTAPGWVGYRSCKGPSNPGNARDSDCLCPIRPCSECSRVTPFINLP